MQKQISTIISLKDKFSAPLLKMGNNIKSLDRETRSSMNRVNRWGLQVEKSVDRALKSTAKWAKRGALVLGGMSAKKGLEGVYELDEAARKVKSIAGDQLNISDIKNDLMDMSYTYGKEIDKLGDSWYDAISASVPMEDTLEAVELAHKIATAGFTDDAEAMRLIATASNAFDLKGIENMKRMADQILLTQNKGVVLVGDMAQGYGSINTLSKSIGASFEEQSAAIATMTKMGMSPSEAITAYKGILNAFLTETSDKTAGYLSELGLGADFLSAKTFKNLGFTGVISEVMKATGGDLDEISKIFKNIRGKTGASIFTGEGLEEYKEIFKLMEDGSEGALDNAFETVHNSLGNQTDILKNKIDKMNTELWRGAESPLSEKILEINTWLDENRDQVKLWIKDIQTWIAKLIDKLIELFKVLRDNKDIVKGVVKFLATIYTLRKVSKWLDNLSKSLRDVKIVWEGLKGGELVSGLLGGAGLTALIKPLLIIASILAFIKYMIDNWGDLKDKFPEFTGLVEWIGTEGFNILKVVFTLILDSLRFIKDLLLELQPLIEGIFDIIIGKGNSFLKILSGIINFIVGIFEMIIGFFSDDMEMMKSGFERTISGISETWEGFVSLVENPISTALDLFGFESGISKARDKWNSFVSFVKRPITTSVKIAQQTANKKTGLNWGKTSYQPGKPIFRNNYKGTPSWKGGLTYLNERGGEIYDLPQGTRIYPHDRSVQMAFEEGANSRQGEVIGGQSIIVQAPVNFYGDVVGDDQYINKVGTQFVAVVKKQLENM